MHASFHETLTNCVSEESLLNVLYVIYTISLSFSFNKRLELVNMKCPRILFLNLLVIGCHNTSKMAAQCCSQGINQQNRVRLLRHSEAFRKVFFFFSYMEMDPFLFLWACLLLFLSVRSLFCFEFLRELKRLVFCKCCQVHNVNNTK